MTCHDALLSRLWSAQTTTGSPVKNTNHFIIYSSQGKWQTLILLTFAMQFALPHLPHSSSKIAKGGPINAWRVFPKHIMTQFWTNTNQVWKWPAGLNGKCTHLTASLCHLFHFHVIWLSSKDLLSCFRQILHHMALTWWVLMDGKSSCWEESHRDGCLNWGMKQKHILI